MKASLAVYSLSVARKFTDLHHATGLEDRVVDQVASSIIDVDRMLNIASS